MASSLIRGANDQSNPNRTLSAACGWLSGCRETKARKESVLGSTRTHLPADLSSLVYILSRFQFPGPLRGGLLFVLAPVRVNKERPLLRPFLLTLLKVSDFIAIQFCNTWQVDVETKNVIHHSMGGHFGARNIDQPLRKCTSVLLGWETSNDPCRMGHDGAMGSCRRMCVCLKYTTSASET